MGKTTKTDQESHETAFQRKNKNKIPHILRSLKYLDFSLESLLQLGNSTNETSLLYFICSLQERGNYWSNLHMC